MWNPVCTVVSKIGQQCFCISVMRLLYSDTIKILKILYMTIHGDCTNSLLFTDDRKRN